MMVAALFQPATAPSFSEVLAAMRSAAGDPPSVPATIKLTPPLVNVNATPAKSAKATIATTAKTATNTMIAAANLNKKPMSISTSATNSFGVRASKSTTCTTPLTTAKSIVSDRLADASRFAVHSSVNLKMTHQYFSARTLQRKSPLRSIRTRAGASKVIEAVGLLVKPQ
jgi:hypothetical protein